MPPSTGNHPTEISNTNIANLGSKAERDIKQNSANSESAWKVVPIPKDQYGTFYSGDSYIILKAYNPNPKSERVAYNLHFRLGTATSHDESGTAAYKTVELDNYLNDLPVQYREMQGHESSLFLGYFTSTQFLVLEGGIKSGFHEITKQPPTPRLLHVKGKGNSIMIKQVPCIHTSLNHGDIFILDTGESLIQWNGSKSNPFEKSKACHVANAICKQRNCKLLVCEDDQSCKDEPLKLFFKKLGSDPTQKIQDAIPDEQRAPEPLMLYCLSDSSGKLSFNHVKTGCVSMTDFKSTDAFILDSGFQIILWVGKSASPSECSNGLEYAKNFLEQHNRSDSAQIIRVIEGSDCPLLDEVLRCQV